MYESVFVPQNMDSSSDSKTKVEIPEKGVVFHNSSKVHTTIIAYDAEIGRSVKIMLRKDEIPIWINQCED